VSEAQGDAESLTPPVAESTAETVPPPAEPPAPPTPPRSRRRRAIWRWTRRLLAVVGAIVAALLVSFFSIDLGRFPALKRIAEQQGSKYLERPLHIGRISALITPGTFAFDDVVIEGKTADGRTADAAPFFRAKRITMYVPWWTLFKKRLEVEVELHEWKMTVETFAGGAGHNIPKLVPKPDPNKPKRPLPFTTTVRFVYAKDGEFEYIDHGTPWRVRGPNLHVEVVRSEALKTYVGKAHFEGGTVQIQKYLPMSADFTARFIVENGTVRLQHIDLVTDGAMSHVTGAVDFSKWPEQSYNVNSTIDFPRMREIFFANETWRITGQGGFQGIFHLFKNGFNLSGQFSGDDVAVNNWEFRDLHGTLIWEPKRFVVTHADSRFLDGDLRFSYGMEPLGTPGGATARVAATYENVDLAALTRHPAINWDVLAPQGKLRGRIAMAWPNGRFSQAVEGDGETVITPVGGSVAAPTLPPRAATEGTEKRPEGTEKNREKPAFDPAATPGRFPLAAQLKYRFNSGSLDFESSTASTPATFVQFSGHAMGGDVRLPVHVTSHDWQESDRLFAAIVAEFGNPVGAIEVGGRGTFDGEFLKSFRAPRIVGRFAAEDMRAWDVTWGKAEGDIVVENGFMDITNGVISRPDATIRTTGRYSLGFKPGQEEMRAKVVLTNWPMRDLRHAFGLDDWAVDGVMALADLDIHGPYRELLGTGKLRIDNGLAWREPFETATADLVFEGDGLRIRTIEMTKGPGRVSGDAWIGWNNSYVFAADGRQLPVESLTNFKVPKAPLSGMLSFKARGEGNFDRPTYEFDGTVADLYAADEGIGQVHGKLTVRDNVLTIDQLDAVSNRLQVSGSGSIALNEHSDSTLFFRLFETSLDPYLKFFAPELSPYTRAIVSGTVDIKGPLADPANLVVDARIAHQDARLTLFAYQVRNEGEIRLAFEDNAFKIGRLILEGQDTLLDVGGVIDAGKETVRVEAQGNANLAILQAFYPDLSSDGKARLNALLSGPFASPALTGTAEIQGGRLRHTSLPHGLLDINGPIRIESGRISVDGVTATMGEGPVRFGGAILLSGGYKPEEYNLTADGRSMRLRYPPGLVSTVDARLALEGLVSSPVLRGRVDVLAAEYRPRLDSENGLLGLAAGGAGAIPASAPPVAGASTGVPIGLDIKVVSGLLPFIKNRQATIEGRANIDVTGSIDRPAITGQITVERGQVFFGENRYQLGRGTIDFSNPLRFEPFFDISAETRARSAGETFRVSIQIRGTFGKFTPTLTSDPYLSEVQILSLILGGTPDIGVGSLQTSNAVEQAKAMQVASLVLITSPISSTVAGVVRDILPFDVVQIMPQLTNLNNDIALRSLSASARVTLGKRVSNNVYLTYSRTLTGNQDEIILLEFDQSDRISWVLSRNEDRTFALDFRIRHVF
jgi:translocation-and-assembly-module (TAM) inner membrane subunit TamB-like protein